MKILGSAKIGDAEVTDTADISGVLKTRFANMRFPPPALASNVAASTSPATDESRPEKRMGDSKRSSQVRHRYSYSGTPPAYATRRRQLWAGAVEDAEAAVGAVMTLPSTAAAPIVSHCRRWRLGGKWTGLRWAGRRSRVSMGQK